MYYNMILSNYSTEWCWIYPIYCILQNWASLNYLFATWRRRDFVIQTKSIWNHGAVCPILWLKRLKIIKKLSFDPTIFSQSILWTLLGSFDTFIHIICTRLWFINYVSIIYCVHSGSHRPNIFRQWRSVRTSPSPRDWRYQAWL